MLGKAWRLQMTVFKIVFWTLPRYYYYGLRLRVLSALLYVLQHIGERTRSR